MSKTTDVKFVDDKCKKQEFDTIAENYGLAYFFVILMFLHIYI